MFLPESLRRLALRSAQRLRGIRGADHIQEVLYVELWMLPALFGPCSRIPHVLHGHVVPYSYHQDPYARGAFQRESKSEGETSRARGSERGLAPPVGHRSGAGSTALTDPRGVRGERRRTPASCSAILFWALRASPQRRPAGGQRRSLESLRTSCCLSTSITGVCESAGRVAHGAQAAAVDGAGALRLPFGIFMEEDQEELILGGGSLPCPLLFSISLPPPPQYIPGPSRSSSPCPSSLFSAVLRPPPPGHLALDLLRLGAHSQTFIQLEKGFAATGLMLVLLMASLESRQLGPRKPGPRWVTSGNSRVECPASRVSRGSPALLGVRVPPSPCLPGSGEGGLEPLQLVQSQLLTTRNLAAASAILLDPRGLFPSHQGGGSVSLRPSRPALPNVWLQTPSEFILSVKGS
ncbi:unnamed protein product [Rangifer tarandus platyrhynchus]|uniref:Uncharacterized protein n=1 Tax=Rangifer tarandus platyrhynchus TaxID=3082113 RepID=A0ABN8YWF3_RANTA|nr:unnamed protein product [Rangifer tarandus platyrhynchus]